MHGATHAERHVDDLITVLNEHLETDRLEDGSVSAAVALLARFTVDTGAFLDAVPIVPRL